MWGIKQRKYKRNLCRQCQDLKRRKSQQKKRKNKVTKRLENAVIIEQRIVGLGIKKVQVKNIAEMVYLQKEEKQLWRSIKLWIHTGKPI